MIALLLSILTSGTLVLLFRFYERFRLPLLPVIVVNYITCVLLGFFFRPQEVVPTFLQFSFSSAYLLSILQGVLFISIFYVMGITTQRISGAYTSLMGKISVVIPTTVSIILFKDPFPLTRKIGFTFALVSLILIHLPYLKQMDKKRQTEMFFLGTTLFLGSGLIDTHFKLYQEWFKNQIPEFGFIVLIFGIAGVLGLSFLLVQRKGDFLISLPVLVGGIFLGSVNFFSLVFLLKGLAQLPATLFFPANNIGIILFTALGERFFFKTSFARMAIIGLGLASLSIWLIVLE